jgi:glycosyltransferase involved in cell wall biosynthesis
MTLNLGDPLISRPRLAHYYPRALAGDGGCSYAVRGWASACALLGARVVVGYDQPGDGRVDDNVEVRRVAHRRRGPLRVPADLEEILPGSDYLIMHSGWVMHNVRAGEIAHRKGVRYIVTPHGAYDPNVLARRRASKRTWWTLMERRLVAHASIVHVFFEEERTMMRRLGYQGQVLVVPSGVRLPHGIESADDDRHVLWMGRFNVHHKGLDVLLNAVARLPERERPPVRLHGPDWRGGKAQTVNLIRRLGLERTVTVGPALYGDSKWGALSKASLFVFASRWEAQGIMALEAAGSGVALVATDTTFIGREFIREGAAIGATANADDLAGAIRRGWMSDNADIRRKAAALVRDRYSWQAVGQRFLVELRAMS